MENLKRCPFCGGEAVLNSDFHQVSCGNPLCGVLPQTWTSDTDEEAIERWNRRVCETTVNQYGENNHCITNVGTLYL